MPNIYDKSKITLFFFSTQILTKLKGFKLKVFSTVNLDKKKADGGYSITNYIWKSLMDSTSTKKFILSPSQNCPFFLHYTFFLQTVNLIKKKKKLDKNCRSYNYLQKLSHIFFLNYQFWDIAILKLKKILFYTKCILDV